MSAAASAPRRRASSSSSGSGSGNTRGPIAGRKRCLPRPVGSCHSPRGVLPTSSMRRWGLVPGSARPSPLPRFTPGVSRSAPRPAGCVRTVPPPPVPSLFPHGPQQRAIAIKRGAPEGRARKASHAVGGEEGGQAPCLESRVTQHQQSVQEQAQWHRSVRAKASGALGDPVPSVPSDPEKCLRGQ